MNDDMTVCAAVLEDAAAITEIYAHYVLESTATFETVPPDESETARRISRIMDAGYPFLVVRDGRGRVLGFGCGHPYGPRVGYRYSVETTIHVRPDCVGRGIGSRLLASLIEECEKRGYRQAFAVIAASEPASVVLHARAGYRPVGTLSGAGWKHGQWIDVFLMQRQLGEGDTTLPEDDRASPAG
ncbi:MAG TPA: GNAT family N-acetyltransferase [Novosphingobium sp.]|nr:GNAT family N-acetyltransferase [Novosphingobium sp.]